MDSMTAATALSDLLGASQKRDVYSEQILLAARKLLTRQGLRNTSLAEIADAAGCSERTLYRRFDDRDALLRAVFVREVEALIEAVDERLTGVADPEDKLVGAFVLLARTLQDNSVLQRLLITDPETILPLATLQAGPLLAITATWVMSYIDADTVVADPGQIAELLIRLAISLALTPSPTFRFETDEQAERLARSLFVPLVSASARVPRAPQHTP